MAGGGRHGGGAGKVLLRPPRAGGGEHQGGGPRELAPAERYPGGRAHRDADGLRRRHPVLKMTLELSVKNVNIDPC